MPTTSSVLAKKGDENFIQYNQRLGVEQNCKTLEAAEIDKQLKCLKQKHITDCNVCYQKSKGRGSRGECEWSIKDKPYLGLENKSLMLSSFLREIRVLKEKIQEFVKQENWDNSHQNKVGHVRDKKQNRKKHNASKNDSGTGKCQWQGSKL